MNILVTGGAGYIGSHTCVELLQSGHQPVIADNFSNSSPQVLKRVERITGKLPALYTCDIRNESDLEQIFQERAIDCVIHFAGLKSVGESVKMPLEYYDNNLNATLSLCRVMRRHHVKRLVFSSSATVYAGDNAMPVDEGAQTGNCMNPYGWTKYISEQILQDLARADTGWSIALLRYFNPIGAHGSGLIGESPNDIPNNLMPYISQTAVGKLEELTVFGDDYDTKDGTGVRDYIHVVDLARGHLAAIDYIFAHTGCEAFNLGTGTGYSVLEMVRAFEKVSDVKVPYHIGARRQGDLAVCYANPKKSARILGWRAQFELESMCRDAWNWQKNNPNGYDG